MKRTIKKWIAVMLAVVMLMGVIPDTSVIAYAEEIATEVTEQELDTVETTTEKATTETTTEATTEITTETTTVNTEAEKTEEKTTGEEAVTEQTTEKVTEQEESTEQTTENFISLDTELSEDEEKINVLRDSESHMIYSDGSWSGGTIWYVKSGNSKHYVFCLEKGMTMYTGTYSGNITSGYSGKSAFKKAVALNFFYKSNGSSWSGKTNYGPAQEVIWDETGSSTAQKLTTYVNHAWNMTGLNPSRASGSGTFSSLLTPIKESSATSASARKQMIAGITKSPVQLKSVNGTVTLSGSSWKYFAKGGYNGGSSDISVAGIYDEDGKAVSGSGEIDSSGNLNLHIEPDNGVGDSKEHPVTVILKTDFDYKGADAIRYVKTSDGKQNMAYDTSFSTAGYFAIQVYTKPTGEYSKVYINKVDEMGEFVSGCTFRLTATSGEALNQPKIPDLCVTDPTDCFEIKYPGEYQIIETAVPDSGEFELNTTPFTFTAERNADNKIVLSATVLNAEGKYDMIIGEASFTYTCVNKSCDGAASITKYGNVLTGYKDGKFVYEKRALEGVGFAFYAAEDIYVNETLVFEAGKQINNGTSWGGKDALGKSRHTVRISGKEVGTHFDKRFYTDASGHMGISGLPVGSYYCVETDFLNGFSRIPKKYYFDIKANQTVSVNDTEGIINEQAPAECHVYKVDADTKEPLGGGEFTIYADVNNVNYDGQPLFDAADTVPVVVSRNLVTGQGETVKGTWVPIQKITTRSDGKAEFENLPEGRYLVAETKAPEGHALAEETYIFEHSYDAEQGVSGYHFEHTFKDSQIRKYKIRKNVETAVPADPAEQNTDVYIYEEEPKAGVVFGIYAAEDIYNTLGNKVAEKDKQITTCTTDDTGTAAFSGVIFTGKYYFKELKTVDDNKYILDEKEYPFSVTADNPNGDLNDEVLVNQLYKGSIKVIKTDGENKVRLSGVTFNLLDADEKLLGSFVTDANGEIQINNLPVGTYYLQESGTQSNYYLNDTLQEVTLTKDDLDKIVQIDNDRMKGSIKVIKTDGKTEQLLEGVEFDLLDSTEQVIGSYVTDVNGEIHIDNLDVGTYYVKETKALKGYKLTDEEIKVEISPEELDKIVQVKNYREKTSITVTTGSTISGTGNVRTGDMGPIGIILALFVLSMGAALLLKKKGILKLNKISVRGGKFLIIFGIAAGTFAIGSLAGNAIVKAATDMKEISTVELTDAEYNGTVYTYALQKQYETNNPDEKIDFDEKLDGLKLADIQYETLDTIPQTKVLEESREYKDLLEEDELKIENSIELDGNVYQLKDVTWSEEPNIEHVSYTQELGYSPSEPTHADTYDYTYTSPVTNKENTVTLPFVRMEHTDYRWVDGFTATVTFKNLDGVYFTLGNHEFEYNPDKLTLTDADYTELVKMLGYDTSKYRLNKVSWSGKPYKGKNGELYRNATATGQQYAASFKAIYEDDVENGTIYTAHATYDCEVEVPAEEAAPTYVRQATAYYQDASVWTNIITFVTEHKAVSVTALGVLLLFIILAIAVFIVNGKRKKVEGAAGSEENQ